MPIKRTAEIDFLNNMYSSPRSELILVHGRRRVGKTATIGQFCKKKRTLYHAGKSAPAAIQLRDFSRQAAAAFTDQTLAEGPVNTWKEALAQVAARLKKRERLVLVLDEIQLTATQSPDLLPALAELWDRSWRRARNIKLVLCSSSTDFSNQLLDLKSPLGQKTTGNLRIQPLGYREAARLHRGWSLADKAGAYFICGGIPYYHQLLAGERSLEKAIQTRLLAEDSPLQGEAELLLARDLRDLASYSGVLQALAQGYATSPEIAAQTGLPERSLHYYLQQLLELGYLARRHPLTGARPAKRHVRYLLSDRFFSFYFCLVFPNLSPIQHQGPAKALRRQIRPQLQNYFRRCYPLLCQQALPAIYKKEKIDASFQTGQYWDPRVEIDLVALRDNGWTDLGLAHWGKLRSPTNLIKALEQKARAFPNPRADAITRRLFLQHPPSPPIPSTPFLTIHHLAQLYD